MLCMHGCQTSHVMSLRSASSPCFRPKYFSTCRGTLDSNPPVEFPTSVSAAVQPLSIRVDCFGNWFLRWPKFEHVRTCCAIARTKSRAIEGINTSWCWQRTVYMLPPARTVSRSKTKQKKRVQISSNGVMCTEQRAIKNCVRRIADLGKCGESCWHCTTLHNIVWVGSVHVNLCMWSISTGHLFCLFTRRNVFVFEYKRDGKKAKRNKNNKQKQKQI